MKVKCDLVIANGELGFVDYKTDLGFRPTPNQIPVKQLNRDFTSIFNKGNVKFVLLEVEESEFKLLVIPVDEDAEPPFTEVGISIAGIEKTSLKLGEKPKEKK